jgi:hypothetical protein
MNARRVAMLYSGRPRSRAHPFEREDAGKVVVEIVFAVFFWAGRSDEETF